MTQMTMSSSQRLWYQQPAANWEEALPIGNGRMGGMVFGGVHEERIDLNEDTLWSGFVRDTNNYDAIRHLSRVRDLVDKRHYKEAEELVERHMLGPWNECYLPLGSLHIQHLEHQGTASTYERSLNVKTGISSTVFSLLGDTFNREVFVSAPEQCMVVSYSSSRSEGIPISVKLESQLKYHIVQQSGNSTTLFLAGRCPSHVEPNYIEDHPQPIIYEEGKGLRFVVGMKVLLDNGTVKWSEQGDALEIRNADRFTFLLTAISDYSEIHTEGYNRELDLEAICVERLEAASLLSYDELKNRHLVDFEALSSRVELFLEKNECSALPTDQRLHAVQQGAEDPDLAALYMHYGRYLLISSSRPGSQPANLQGLWSREIRAPWGSNWTTNINIQMNYWHAETSNLRECHMPLFDWTERLAQKGKRTALIHYGSKGWAAHHNVDIWMDSSPAGGQAVWAFWPMAGAWLCAHLWEHYAFHQDDAYLLQKAFPIMKGAAEFYLDWLILDSDTGRFITSPSTSPENKFLTPEGEPCAISKASTLDLILIRELFTNCMTAIEILNQDHELGQELQRVLRNLQPLQIGNDGRLQEWMEPHVEHEPGHRHLSHLYGLYPGAGIQFDRDEELTKAIRASLEYRLEHGGGRTGWSCAWGMALWARLRDGEEAHENWLALLQSSTFLNLFDGHPYMIDTRIDYSRSIFQIDGNLGTAAAIVEMLVQSHADEIHLLPALPAAWSEGQVRGLRARGGCTVDMSWQDGKVTDIRLVSEHGGSYWVRTAVALNIGASVIQSLRVHEDYRYEIRLQAEEQLFLKAMS
ncbi:glycoside hydrolase family 95 protein [Paenibacillus sp. FSL R10-2734]|uniref:glycoside hydrolase family 95 protein n=1 Tax=Paenibacillus sp. FSL R10-2734 TaxID=2954691 RepID=UPI0030DB3D27